jgi:F-type H+-transporting ATPase subunit epsilon
MNGEFAIMKDHIPIISSVDIGYVKMVRDTKELYTVIINGVVEHNNNIINVIAQEAHVGLSKDSALEHLNTVREERIRENKRRNVDFAKAERELKKNVKDAKAGNL